MQWDNQKGCSGIIKRDAAEIVKRAAAGIIKMDAEEIAKKKMQWR